MPTTFDWISGHAKPKTKTLGGSTTGGGAAADEAPSLDMGRPGSYRPTFGGSGALDRPNTPWNDEDLRRFNDQVIDFGGKYVDWIAQQEESRGAAAEDIVRRAAAGFDAPSMSDRDIQRMATTAGDRSAREFKSNMGNLRSYLGGAGVTGGGVAAQLATNYEAQRQAVLTDATRSLYEKKVAADAADRAARFNAQLQVANIVGRDPSVAPMDWLTTAAGLRLGEFATIEQLEEAARARKASERAGVMSGIGGVLSGLGPLIGGL
jgi:hypothetical protein